MYFNIDIQVLGLLFIILLMVIFFVLELFPMEVTALGTIGLLLLFNIITIDEAVSGFSNKAVITIGAIFIISSSLVKTGFLEVLANQLYKIGGISCFLVFISVLEGSYCDTPGATPGAISGPCFLLGSEIQGRAGSLIIGGV